MCHQEAGAEATGRHFRFEFFARSAGKQRRQVIRSERRTVVLEYELRWFVMKADGDGASATRPRIESVLKELDGPTNARGMRIAAGFMDADTYAPCLVARMLVAKRLAEEVVCFLGHSRVSPHRADARTVEHSGHSEQSVSGDWELCR